MFRPIGDHILVQPLAKEEVTKSGIVLPDSAQEKPQEGTVLAVGTGKYLNDKLISHSEMGIKVGDVVMFTKYGPTEVKINEETLYILDSGDILGVVDEKKK
jgi:chaperonin GroES